MTNFLPKLFSSFIKLLNGTINVISYAVRMISRFFIAGWYHFFAIFVVLASNLLRNWLDVDEVTSDRLHVVVILTIVFQFVQNIRKEKQRKRHRLSEELKNIKNRQSPFFDFGRMFLVPKKKIIPFRWIDTILKRHRLKLSKTEYKLQDGEERSFFSLVNFSVTEKQLFEMKLHGWINTERKDNVWEALDYLGIDYKELLDD